jgi:hypothetical protein
MKRFLTKIAEKLKGENKRESEDKLEVEPEPEFEFKPLAELEKIEFSPRDCEKTRDFLENIRLYKEALEKIRYKYRLHILETYYMNSEELIRRENFCRRSNISPEGLERKINNLCAKNKISDKKLLYILKEDVDPEIKKELEQTIAAEIKLEKIKFLGRDDNCFEERFNEGVALAKAHRSPKEVDALEKMLEENKVKGEGNRIRDGAKLMMTHVILNDIASDVNPSGERREGTEYASNWKKKLNLLKENLGEKGIYLDERYEGHQTYKDEIKQTWAEINEQVKEENAAKRSFEKILDEVFRKHPQIGLEYYCAVLEEHRNMKKTGGLKEYSKEPRKLANKTEESRLVEKRSKDMGAR